MTLSAGPVSVVYVGNGSASTFSVANGGQPIVFIDSADICVMQLVTATGAITTLTEGTDYDLTGGPDAGVVTRTAGALPAGYVWGIYRAEALSQETSLGLGGSFSSATVEAAFDKVTRLAQDLQDQLSRAPSVSLLDRNAGSLELPQDRANKVLAFGADGSFEAWDLSMFGATELRGEFHLAQAPATQTTVTVAGMLADSFFEWVPKPGANSALAADMMPFLSPIVQTDGSITFEHPATSSVLTFKYKVSI